MAERKKVLDVVYPLQESRINGFDQSIAIYESSSRCLAHTFDICKRKIAESNGIESKFITKKVKLERIVETNENRENTHPNINTVQNENEHPHDVLKKVTSENDRPQSIIFDGRSIISMRVVELREELGRRDLDTKGVKKVLQSRLKEALETDLPKEELRSDSVEDVDMVTETCTEEEVAKDMKIADSTSKSLNSNNGENLKVSTIVGDLKNKNNNDTVSMIDTEFDQSRMSSNNAHTDDVIMEGQSTASIPDVSTHVCYVEDSENNEKSDRTEDNTSSSLKEKISQMKSESTVEDSVGIGSEVENNTEIFQHPASDPSIMYSPKKGLGHKLFKVTSKLFSPKKNTKSPGKTQLGITSPNSKASGCIIPGGNNSEGGIDISHASIEKPHHEKAAISHKTDPVHQYKRGSLTCKMSETDIQAHEIRAKAQTAMIITEEKKYHLESNKSCQVVQPESKALSKPQPKVVATPIVSSKMGSAQSTIKKAKALQDARKARLAEMREKASKGAKVVTLANSSKNTRIAMQKTTNAAIVAKNGNRKKAIAAEMRQKVAEAAKEKADSLKLADAGQSETTANQGLSHSHLMQNAQATFKQKQKCMSPMDTYEMSDRGESDSESEDESEFEEKSSKKIPKWAQKVNLIPALEIQFMGGQQKVDPDEIFPEVSTCDLEAIFDKQKKRYSKRASTGNWTKDGVTASEQLVYKRKMGFKSKR